MAVVETRQGKVEGKHKQRDVSASVLLAERRLWQGQTDGATVGKL